MKTFPLTRILILLALLATSAPATIVISQTNNYSNVGNSGTPYSWNQFDGSLGTLTSVIFTLNGTISGSFGVTSTDNFDGVDVSNPQARLLLTFDGSNPKPANLIGAYSPFSTTPSTSSAFTITAGGSQTFSIIEPASLTPFTSTNLVSFNSYFVGTGTFNTTILRGFTVTLAGGTSTQDYSTALSSGVMTLEYVYDAAPIPEPGTWAAAALLLGAAGYVRWRRRQAAQ